MARFELARCKANRWSLLLRHLTIISDKTEVTGEKRNGA